jgi:hypothetical protein
MLLTEGQSSPTTDFSTNRIIYYKQMENIFLVISAKIIYW